MSGTANPSTSYSDAIAQLVLIASERPSVAQTFRQRLQHYSCPPFDGVAATALAAMLCECEPEVDLWAADGKGAVSLGFVEQMKQSTGSKWIFVAVVAGEDPAPMLTQAGGLLVPRVAAAKLEEGRGRLAAEQQQQQQQQWAVLEPPFDKVSRGGGSVFLCRFAAEGDQPPRKSSRGGGDREAEDEDMVKGFMAKFKKSPTTLSTLGVHEDIVDQLNAFVYMFKYPEAAQLLKPGAGVLLFGLPGTGKSFLARALAGELGAEMFAVDSAEVKGMWVGEGERRIKGVFKAVAELARQDTAKRFVLFFDELENLARARSDRSVGSAHTQDQTTALLQAYEAFVTLSADIAKRLVIVGATNFPSQVDSAVARRLGTHIEVPLPSALQREAAFKRKFTETCANACSIQMHEADAEAQLAAVVEHSENFSLSDIHEAILRVQKMLIMELGNAMEAAPPPGDDDGPPRPLILVHWPSPHIAASRSTDPTGSAVQYLTAAEATARSEVVKLCRRPLWADVANVVRRMPPSNGPGITAAYRRQGSSAKSATRRRARGRGGSPDAERFR